jgi:hypothetical protein
MGFAEFLTLAGQYGLWNAVAAVCILFAGLIFYGWSKTRNEVTKSEASDARNLTGALVKLVDKLGTMDERGSIERSQTLLTIEKLAGRMEGMTTAILSSTQTADSVKKSVEGVVGTLDEFGTRIQHLPRIDSNVIEIKSVTATLETNLGETLNDQIGPLVATLTGIENELKVLVNESAARDNRTNVALMDLTGLVQQAKIEFMKLLAPIVEKHIDHFVPKESPLSITPQEPVKEEKSL